MLKIVQGLLNYNDVFLAHITYSLLASVFHTHKGTQATGAAAVSGVLVTTL